MKKELINQMKKSRCIILIILCVIGSQSGFSQLWHSLQVSTNTAGPGLYQSNSTTRNYFRIGDFSGGIGTNSPTATFHLRDYFINFNFPMFENDAKDANNSIIGSIKHLILTDTGYYAIWQQGSEFKNYFDGDIVCNSTLGFNGQNSGIWIKNQDEGFPFRYSITAPDPAISNPLTIKYNGIKVQHLMECDNFRLYDNAGDGRVLVSDQIGNGMWQDASNFHDDDWLPAAHIGNLNMQDLYLNKEKYEFVGIGTDRPAQKLHVLDGNILISRSISGGGSGTGAGIEAPGSKNGSVLFGDFITEKSTLGEWGIEYYTGNDDYTSNGLNFWKPFSSGNGGGNDYLYLRNDGDIGIGTEKTCGYKLAVKGKILCTELKVIDIGEFCDYVFDKSYKLMPLYDVERFINANHHLPDVPSADEVKSNGLNMGEMNTLLMKKVEELTLYAIDQQKQIINQQKQIDELKLAIQNK